MAAKKARKKTAKKRTTKKTAAKKPGRQKMTPMDLIVAALKKNKKVSYADVKKADRNATWTVKTAVGLGSGPITCAITSPISTTKLSPLGVPSA